MILYGAANLLFLLACLAPRISPAHYWPFAFLGLAFPFLLVVELILGLSFLFLNARWSLIILLSLALGWRSLSSLVAWPSQPAASIQVPGSLKILSYNVHYFRAYDDRPDPGHKIRDQMLDLIASQRADILCLQEFFTSESPREFDFKAFISKRLHYPYRYFSSDYNSGDNHSGVILFSRYPILDAAKIRLEPRGDPESAIYADLVLGGDTVRVYTMHLQSIYLNRKDLAGLERIPESGDSGLQTGRTILGKLRRAFIRRAGESDLISAAIRHSPHPVIVCGDFNDTPDSYAYFRIRSGLQDAFLEKGLGIGATYRSISPTLRIDYIFASLAWKVQGFSRLRSGYSDHFPVLATLVLKRDG